MHNDNNNTKDHSHKNHLWRMVTRWPVDDDGAEDMIVMDAEHPVGNLKLLAKRHERAGAPATWCCAYSLPDGRLSRDTILRELGMRGLSEHITDLAEVYDVLDWRPEIVHNVAARAVEEYERFVERSDWMERHGI